jgi:hypothetical protein
MGSGEERGVSSYEVLEWKGNVAVVSSWLQSPGGGNISQ